MQTRKRTHILSASAGAGKTFRLVLKYICEVLEHPECYRNILAITFTNKATEEMKSRIINELNHLASGDESAYLEEIMTRTGFSEPLIRAKALKARTEILHDYSRFAVLTIDSFFQRILHAFINELSLDLDYNIELDTGLILERSVDNLIENITNEEYADIKKLLMEYAEERLEEGDRWDIRRDLNILGGELFKDGVAKRISSSINKNELSTIVKALVKGNNDKIKRIKSLAKRGVEYLDKRKLNASNFKGGNPTFITCFKEFASGKFKKDIITTAIINAAQDATYWYKKDEKDINVITAARVLRVKLEKICKLYTENIENLNTTKIIRDKHHSFALLSDLYNSIDDICKTEGIMVLDKTKELLAEFIDESNAPFIYEKVGSRYDRYMIDEFQDTSTREWRNIRPLLEEALSSTTDASVFIVGDIKQSIYRWRGGDWRLLNTDVIEDLKQYSPEVEPLKTNRRSLKNIIEFNNKFIRNVVTDDNNYINNLLDEKLKEKKISESTKEKLYDVVNTAYTECEQEAHLLSDYGIAKVSLYDAKLIDAPFIEAIKSAIDRGYRYKDILVLVRGKSDGKRVVSALYDYKNEIIKHNETVEDAKDKKVVFNILTADSLTIESCDVIKFIISVMRLAIDPSDNIERGIYNGYLPDHDYGAKLSEEELELLGKIAHLSALEAFELIVEHFDLHTNRNHIAHIQAMHEQILSFTSNNIADIQHYLAWWDERGHKETLSVEKTDDTIEITTIHKAKGLERDVVIIPECSWSMTPSSNNPPIIWAKANEDNSQAAQIGEFPVTYNSMMENSAFAEEYWKEQIMSHVDGINLLYVAVTRAKKELYIYVPSSLNVKNSKANPFGTVAGLTKRAMANMPEMVAEPPMRNMDNKIVYQTYTYGKAIEHFTPKADDSSSNSILLESYPTHAPDVAVHYPMRRYVEEGMTPGTTSCDKGIKLHKVFEGANTIEDLYRAIDKMQSNSHIAPIEAEELRTKIKEAMQHDTISAWFSGEWEDIKHEANILRKGKTQRPDRVMIKDGRAVVVDYKFGDKTNKQYHKKMKEYIKLLDEMDCYSAIEGYIWYINLGIVERVER